MSDKERFAQSIMTAQQKYDDLSVRLEAALAAACCSSASFILILQALEEQAQARQAIADARWEYFETYKEVI